jgi:hypothetical protein
MPKKNKLLFEPASSFTLTLTAIICGFIILEPYYPGIRDFLARLIPPLKAFDFLPNNSNEFVGNFIEWFGVLYGLLLPLILVRAWEQFDAIGREFDREADTIKLLYEDVLLFFKEDIGFKSKFLSLLLDYVGHVKTNYQNEAKDDSKERIHGDILLSNLREEYYKLTHSEIVEKKEGEILVSELLHQLNEVIDVRGDRISLCNQRLFQSLRFVALFASLIFAVPFYFVKFHQDYGFLDSFLVFSVIFLVIFILNSIEDLDEPFFGSWRINRKPWIRLHDEITKSLSEMGTLVNATAARTLTPGNKPRKEFAQGGTKKTDSRRTQRADERKGVGKKKKPSG